MIHRCRRGVRRWVSSTLRNLKPKFPLLKIRTREEFYLKNCPKKKQPHISAGCYFLPLAPKLRFGSALANETPFHMPFVAPVNFIPDANTLKRGLFEELQHLRRSSAASYTLSVIGELEIEDLE